MKAPLAIATVLPLAASSALARDLDGRYAGSPLHDWFMGLRSGLGPCCSDADERVVADADWIAASSASSQMPIRTPPLTCSCCRHRPRSFRSPS